MPAITIPKTFTIGGANLYHGKRGQNSVDPTLYQVVEAMHSDMLVVRAAVSELISADGGSTSAISLGTKLTSFA